MSVRAESAWGGRHGVHESTLHATSLSAHNDNNDITKQPTRNTPHNTTRMLYAVRMLYAIRIYFIRARATRPVAVARSLKRTGGVAVRLKFSLRLGSHAASSASTATPTTTRSQTCIRQIKRKPRVAPA